MASNDSDSELEEASDPLSSSDASALHRLSFLEQPEVEAGLEEGPQSRSGSEEQLEGEDGDPGQRLCAFNTNQSNNTARVPLPTMRLRGGRLHVVPVGTGGHNLSELDCDGGDRQPLPTTVRRLRPLDWEDWFLRTLRKELQGALVPWHCQVWPNSAGHWSQME